VGSELDNRIDGSQPSITAIEQTTLLQTSFPGIDDFCRKMMGLSADASPSRYRGDAGYNSVHVDLSLRCAAANSSNVCLCRCIGPESDP
jgi:hypothetical protein